MKVTIKFGFHFKFFSNFFLPSLFNMCYFMLIFDNFRDSFDNSHVLITIIKN
jgi:hypothetical protein